MVWETEVWTCPPAVSWHVWVWTGFGPLSSSVSVMEHGGVVLIWRSFPVSSTQLRLTPLSFTDHVQLSCVCRRQWRVTWLSASISVSLGEAETTGENDINTLHQILHTADTCIQTQQCEFKCLLKEEFYLLCIIKVTMQVIALACHNP